MIKGGSRPQPHHWKFTQWRTDPKDRKERLIYAKSYRQWIKKYLDKDDGDYYWGAYENISHRES